MPCETAWSCGRSDLIGVEGFGLSKPVFGNRFIREPLQCGGLTGEGGVPQSIHGHLREDSRGKGVLIRRRELRSRIEGSFEKVGHEMNLTSGFRTNQRNLCERPRIIGNRCYHLTGDSLRRRIKTVPRVPRESI